MAEDVVEEMSADEAAARVTHTFTRTSRGFPMLVDSRGYEYNSKGQRRDGSWLWNCLKKASCRGCVEMNPNGDITHVRYHICAPKVM